MQGFAVEAGLTLPHPLSPDQAVEALSHWEALPAPTSADMSVSDDNCPSSRSMPASPSSCRTRHPEDDESQGGLPTGNSPRSDPPTAKGFELEACQARVELLEAALASEQERYDADMRIRIDGAFGAHEAMAAVTGAMLARSVHGLPYLTLPSPYLTFTF